MFGCKPFAVNEVDVPLDTTTPLPKISPALYICAFTGLLLKVDEVLLTTRYSSAAGVAAVSGEAGEVVTTDWPDGLGTSSSPSKVSRGGADFGWSGGAAEDDRSVAVHVAPVFSGSFDRPQPLRGIGGSG